MADLLVFGRTGIHVLRHAAERSHRVRALVRNSYSAQARPGIELAAIFHMGDVLA